MLEVKDLDLLNQKKVSLNVSEGEYLQVIGPNGSGKSLLLKSISQLIPSACEKLSLYQKNSNDFSPEEWRKNVMYLPAQIFGPHDQTVEEFILFPLKFHVYKNFSPTFDPFRYLSDKTKALNHLSTGEKQKLMILRALMLSPKMLILDETLSNLDEEKRLDLMNVIKSQSFFVKSVIIVSHFKIPELITRNYYL